MDDIILINFLRKELSASEMSHVEQWINSSEENAKYFQKIKFLWEEAARDNQKIRINKEEAWVKIHKGISQKKEPLPRDPGQLHYLFRRIAAAAILIISIGAIALILKFQDRTKEINWVNEIASAEKKEVILPDDSRVWLNKNATLQYPEKFKGGTRSVILSGEAFFEVDKQKSQPFVIRTNNSWVEVLGTSFNVNAEASAPRVIVSVVSGKVALFDSTRKDNRILLEAGDQGIFMKEGGTLNKERIVDRNFLAWKTGVLVFINAPIEHVCQELSRHFDQQIEIIPTPELSDKKLTATYDNKDLDDILRIIELTLDIGYTRDQGKIVLFMN